MWVFFGLADVLVKTTIAQCLPSYRGIFLWTCSRSDESTLVLVEMLVRVYFYVLAQIPRKAVEY